MGLTKWRVPLAVANNELVFFYVLLTYNLASYDKANTSTN